nr:hypothetical protein [uncultured Psychroserpens sp.]
MKKVFCQTSAAYTTTNQYFKLSHDDYVSLTSGHGHVSNRNDIIHPKNLQSNIIIIEDNKDLVKNLEVAIKWLNE